MLVTILALVPMAAGASSGPVMGGVVPQPVSLQPTPGVTFSIRPKTVIEAERGNHAAMSVANDLADLLRVATGFALPVVPIGSPQPQGAITFTLAQAPASVGQEGYAIDVDQNGVAIRALTGAGWFHGVQTLRQLLPAAAGKPRKTGIDTGPWLVPGGHILDHPRFSYRGAMVDVSRHFFGVADIKRYIDAISLYKINVLHLHLSDDQGWRIYISSLAPTRDLRRVHRGRGWPRRVLHPG